MIYYGLLIDLFHNAERVLKGYCKTLDREECQQKLLREFEEGFRIFNFSALSFLNYNLYGLITNTLAEDDEPLFKGKINLTLVNVPLTYNLDPESIEEPLEDLNGAFGYSPHDGRYWMYSVSNSKFHLPLKEGRSGLYGFSPERNTLGNFNYGYELKDENYYFHNIPLNMEIDEDCEGTEGSKAQSIYTGKFNCVYGQKYTNDNVEELELFGIKNPGFKNGLALFSEPNIPYLKRKEDLNLYEYPGKFYNPPVEKYGIPFTFQEQLKNESLRILDHLINYCLSSFIFLV